jgi:hypothetical protein
VSLTNIASTRRALAGGLTAAAAALVLAPSALGKSTTVELTDPVGDAPVPAQDVVAASITYSKGGTLSGTVTMAGPIDPVAADAGLGIVVTGVRKGKCSPRLMLTVGTAFSEDVAYAFAMKNLELFGRPSIGSTTIDQATLSFKVKNKKFKNQQVGCVLVTTTEPVEKHAKTYDDTSGEDRFPR